MKKSNNIDYIAFEDNDKIEATRHIDEKWEYFVLSNCDNTKKEDSIWEDITK